jgi:dipeptidyl aminopeptidase/acylaminoacyl peptidase
LTPPFAVAAALSSTHNTGGASRAVIGAEQQSSMPAGGGAAAFAASASFSAGNAPSEAAMPNGTETRAKRAGEKLAASTVPVRLRKTVDKHVAGKQNLKLLNTQNKNNALAAFAAPERVFSIAPTTTKPAASAAKLVAPNADKTTPEVVRVVKAPATTAKTGAGAEEQLSAVAKPAVAELGKSIATEKTVKENHVSNLSRDAVSPGVSADSRRDLVSDSPKMSPEMVTPSTLNREISSTNKTEQVAKFDAPAQPGVLYAANAATWTASAAQRGVSFTSPVAPSLETKATDAPTTLSAAKTPVVAETAAPETVADTTTDAKLEAAASTATTTAAMTAAFAPANDNLALAQVVSGLPGTTTASNVGATREAGEPYHAYDMGGASVWFKWQATATRSVDFSTAGSGFDTVLAVYQGASVSSLSEVASNDEVSATDSTSRVTFDAIAGQIYYIAVDGGFDGYTAASGTITLNWSATTPPANNGFGAAQVLAAATTGSVTGTNRGATIQAYEPFHANNDGGKSVWYKWTAPSTGNIEFSTAGSNFDTLLGVYTGTAINALTPIASNDEEDFNAGIHTGRVVFNAVAGTVYYIAVDGFYNGYAADWGDIALAWKVGPAVPANNNFATAQAITGNEGRIKGSNWLATKETGEPAHAGVAGGKSIWYRFQAPGTGKVSFDTMGSTVDTVMGVYTGTGIAALTAVTSNDDADAPGGVWTSRVTFDAVAGTVYYLAIDAWSGEAGTIILRTPRKAGKVAFASNRDGDDEIFVMNSDGSGQQQLTANTATDTRPDWSPDGTKIVFESDRDGNTELYVMNADGTGQTRLTTNTANDNQPVWSPDGTKIAFTSDRAIGAGDGNGNGGYELYVMNADGTNVVRLTYQEGTDSRPEWSPDGGKLIFASTFFGNWDIHRLSAVTGGDKWRLTTHPGTETNPVVDPFGTMYAFQGNATGNNDLWVIQPNGAAVNLSNNPASDEALDYSPDGESIIFSTTRDGNSDIYVMKADGTGQTNITYNVAADTFPDWQSVTGTPNTLPTVALTAPVDGTKLAAPATISLTATASDTGGSIASVAFYAGTTLIATDTAAPYSASWASVGAGTYSLTAVATDNFGAKTTSASVRVTVNPALSVAVENPTGGTTLDTNSTVTINAQAAANTTTISKVEFYYAAAATPTTKTLIGTDTTAPYSFQWNTASPAIAAGNYLLSAKVTDSALATATSANVSIALKAPVTNPPAAACAKTVTANVVAFDQVYTYNRFGAFNPAGMMYALKRDVVAIDSSKPLAAGNVQLRPDKRPRPLVLRVNEGDCLQVTFTNLLTSTRDQLSSVNNTNQPNKQTYTGAPVKFLENDSTFTRAASLHVNGLDYVNGPGVSDGANVGKNASSLVETGQTKTYTWYGRKQGQYMIHSMGANVGGEGDGGQTVLGLFGAVVVEPQGAKWYRSQVTAAQLAKVTSGRNPDNTPKINFEAADASGAPILNMLTASNEIVHTDVNALITGFTENCTNAPPSSTCGQPFREFVVIFHDETKTVQAFPELDAELFHGVRDGFAINYGSASLGAPLVANRKKVGPSKDCGECKFEEFFLESWANGDPSMVVRTDSYGRANEVLFPDDPSGVHHSYLGDPVRFRNIHVGPKETHVFHLHAHQWLHEPREDDSTYLDSQTIGPGSGFTYEINYGGSGNRNFTAGDSIFHCHLYPHFAQGMWELWRVHDVFEQGTPDRNLPDAEITGGTPNPAIVPLPNRAMAPMPTADVKGYPFFVAAQAGHRPPQPPLDIEQDGGLPRHRIAASEFIDGKDAIHPHLLTDPVAARVLSLNNDPNLLAFARELTSAKIELLPLEGTNVEKKAMEFHEGKGGVKVTTQYGWPAAAYPAYTPTGASGLFLVNGQPRQPGAPFAEPCAPGTSLRNYRAAYIQFDMTVNKAGWHDRQARITTLEDDALATRDGQKAPEPFFFRANSNDCIQFKATNLVPHVLNLDDFQIFTPTDTIGQHIHLVKFDVMASDGAGNGWNYEDGTFSPGEVQERVHANNNHQTANGGSQILSLVTNPKFGDGPDLDGNGIGDYVGAQTTTQRWWADPLLNNNGTDRTIRTVFSHDHFGPSSHQHHGLYGALVVEPAGSKWETTGGTPMGTRADGGPTSYAANILPGDATKSYREFNLAIADFALVYTPELKPINPPGRKEIGLPFILEPPAIPQPESISAGDPGTGLVNYRNEPIPLRVRDGATNTQFTDARGDMANVFRSKDDAGNTIHGDPFTPLLEAYEGDKVQIRLIQGAQEEQHVFSLHGGKWLHEPSSPNSGWYNAQGLGISEHFEFEVPPIPAVGNVAGGNKDVADFMYGSFSTDNLWNGVWGILRSYKGLRTGLKALPSNTAGTVSSSDAGLRTDFCPATAPQRSLLVEAWLAKDLVGPNGIVYNTKFGLKDPAGIVFVQQADVAAIKAGTKKLEPLVLRANAGDCINVQLTNKLPLGTTPMPDYDAWNLMPMLIPQFNLNQLKSSKEVSLHPQLLEYDVRTSDGANIGLNDKQTASPGETKKYRWYAGKVTVNADGSRTAQPIEYGATNLTNYGDIMKHGSHGAGGVLVVEPLGSTWTTAANSNAEAEVRNAAGSLLFKEFVVVYQDDVNMLGPNTAQGQTILGLAGVNPVRNYAEESDSEDSGMKAFNYRTEPLWARLGFLQEMTKRDYTTFLPVSELLNDVNQANVFSSTTHGDPETPVFSVAAGTGVRFRVVQPTGHPRQHGFTIYGHNWFHEPWRENSTIIWSPGFAEPNSTTIGTQGGHTARRHWNVILRNAGGAFSQPGDYMFRTQESYNVTSGMWGIFRVTGTTTTTTTSPTGVAVQ